MHDTPPSPAPELPTARRLIRSTVIAAATAAVLLVTTVLPAEYGVDPTGIGSVLGLTDMGLVKRELAREAAAAEVAEAAERGASRATPPAAPSAAAGPSAASVRAAAGGSPADPPAAGATAPVAAPSLAAGTAGASGAEPAAVQDATTKVDVIHVTLRPSESKEVKLVMRKGARVQYAWTADGGTVSFETHGDTLRAPPGVFHSYSKGRNASAHQGTFVAVFDGMHGWFWRNRSREVVTLTLRTEGEYRELRRME